MLSKAFLPHIQGHQALSRSGESRGSHPQSGFPVSSSQQGRATPPSRQLQGTAPGAHRLFPGTPSPQPRCTRLRTAKGKPGEQLTWASGEAASSDRRAGLRPRHALRGALPGEPGDPSPSRFGKVRSSVGCRDLRKYVGEAEAAAQAERRRYLGRQH